MCVLTYDDIQKKNAVKKKNLHFKITFWKLMIVRKNNQYMDNSMVYQCQIKTKLLISLTV